ncbi:MAG: hypothetical protein ACPL0B_01835, partial [Anaerolineales bacterium]
LCRPLDYNTNQCGETFQDWKIEGSDPIVELNRNLAPTNSSQSQAFQILSPHPGAIFIQDPQRPTIIPISIRSNLPIDYYQIYINQKLVATLDQEPYQFWFEAEPGEIALLIEGWQHNTLVATQDFKITVKPPLR